MPESLTEKDEKGSLGQITLVSLNTGWRDSACMLNVLRTLALTFLSVGLLDDQTKLILEQH